MVPSDCFITSLLARISYPHLQISVPQIRDVDMMDVDSRKIAQLDSYHFIVREHIRDDFLFTEMGTNVHLWNWAHAVSRCCDAFENRLLQLRLPIAL